MITFASIKAVWAVAVTYRRAILIGLALALLILGIRHIYNSGRKDADAAWEANTAIAEKAELTETVNNQKEAHEIRSRNAARANGDAFRLLIENWSR